MVFGAVERVDGDAIGTKFLIFGPLVWPLQSFYVSGSVPDQAPPRDGFDTALLLMAGGSESVSVAIPMRALNRPSVVAGYVRLVAALGLMIAMMAFCARYGLGAPKGLEIDVYALAVGLAVGAAFVGGASYLISPWPDPRDRRIRRAGMRITGVAADLAHAAPAALPAIVERLDATLADQGVDWRRAPDAGLPPPSEIDLLVLVRIRAAMANDDESLDADVLERWTDVILDRQAETLEARS